MECLILSKISVMSIKNIHSIFKIKETASTISEENYIYVGKAP